LRPLEPAHQASRGHQRNGPDHPERAVDELPEPGVGARLTDAFAGRRLSRAARQALVKIEAVLPEDLRRRTERSRVFAPATAARAALRDRLDLLHEAVDERRVVHLRYATPGAAASERDVESLCLAFWGQAWTLGAWCRARRDFRTFRVDRMEAAELGNERFTEDPARSLAAYLERAGADPELLG
jgi:predicted DNA-binding transcriptional regulator YafY